MLRNFLIAVAVLVAPEGWTQEDACARYQPFLEAAPKQFESLKAEDVSLKMGAQREGLVFASSQTAEGYPNCVITESREDDGPNVMLACRSEILSALGARVVYDQELQRLGACLAGWEEVPPDDVADTEFIKGLAGQHFVKYIGDRKLRHGVALAEAKWGGRTFHVHALVFSVTIEQATS